MHVLVTGGCGYVGSVLVPKLLAAGHHVMVRDLMWFGCHLTMHERLDIHKGDFRDIEWADCDAVIHLAGIANDPAGDLDPKLTWEVNALGTAQLAAACQDVKQFIYASSGSVYGVSDAPNVTEEMPLVPISEYNKTKMVAERVLLSYADKMAVQIIRPATVCGWSPRMRLDTVVNMLTMQALHRGVIYVLGGTQIRPNIHIEDMCDAYLWMLDHPQLTGIYNAGFENMSVTGIARKVSDCVPSRIVTLPSTDPRSYRLSSQKLLDTGFKPKKGVSNAIMEIAEKYHSGQLKDRPEWHNLKAMPKAA